MKPLPLPILTAGLLLAAAARLAAQTLVFAAGSVDFADVTISGTNIERKSNPGRPIPIASLVRVDFPRPEELAAADDLLLKGKYDEAFQKAKSAQDLHRLWKDKPGSWFAQAGLLVAESLLRQNKYDESARLMSELRNLALSPDLQIRVTMLDALEQYQKGITGPALAKVKPLARTGQNADTLARLHLLTGDIQFKREAFDEALEAYLQIPVFYGAEAAFLPAAELGAAKCLTRLSRLQDANDSLTRIIERYAGTPEAEAAKIEKTAVGKLTGAAP
jgi:tetratricopeptide (TPR) repeat protein